MDDFILISQLNDFVFCPASIYFHELYGSQATITYQCSDQINGSAAHQPIDQNRYSTRKNVLQSVYVESTRYKVVGRIDVFDIDSGTLTERKKKIKVIYDGYVFQMYAQYYGLTELGYTVKKMQLHSMDDNKTYPVALPEHNQPMQLKFENLIKRFRTFQLDSFYQTNKEKCRHCIYEPACDRSLL